MEWSMKMACVMLIGLAIWSCVWKVVKWVWVRPRKLERILRKQGLNGNSYKFLKGDLKESSDMTKLAISKPITLSDSDSHDISSRILPFIHYTLNKYGKNCFMWEGPIPGLIITKPEDVKEIFSKFGNFTKPKQNPFLSYLFSGLSWLEGEQWAIRRKIINPAFHMDKLKSMVPAFHSSTIEMLNKWESLVKDGHESCEVDVWPYFQSMTADVISRTAFGRSYEDGRRLFSLLAELAGLISKSVTLGYIPGWRFIPTKLNKRLKGVDKEIQGLLKDMIENREKAMKSGEAGNEDLLSVMMHSNMTEQRNKKTVGMSLQDIVAECKLFYFAGQETSAILLSFTMVMLSHHPNWQHRAREEVLRLFQNDQPHFEGLVHLKVVTMILNEVLRLFPPAPILRRTVENETRLGKLCLPAGTLVTIPMISIHCDTQLWGNDAHEFNPERFSGGVLEATNGKLSFFPFSGGPRVCIGQNFAMIEVKLALALILQRFNFELSPSYTHAPIKAVTIRPQHGVHLILHKR